MVAPGASVTRDGFGDAPERLGVLNGIAPAQSLATLDGVDAVALWADSETSQRYREILGARDGPIIPLLVEADMAYVYTVERHVCIDTTASGGNALLLAGVDDAT